MPTSPVKTRIPLTSFGHLITEVKTVGSGETHCCGEADICQQRQLFGIEAPATVQLTGWRKYFNSYTLQGRRNCVLATYGVLVVAASAYLMHRSSKEESRTASSAA